MRLDKMGEISLANHDQPCAMWQLLMISAHGMLQRMLTGTGTEIHRITGNSIGKGHLLPGLEISAIIDRLR